MKKLAIIFPYKNREYHKCIMIPYISYFLNKHNLDYQIFVVEPTSNIFNRGLILNIGFKIIDEFQKFDYICLHDIDMLPIECDYSYEETHPVHLATGCSQFNYKLPYGRYFGGVNLFTIEQFKKINGFSNRHWIWGHEDDNLLKRCELVGYKFIRRKSIHFCFDHNRDKTYEKTNKKIPINIDEGLSDIKFSIVKYDQYDLYNHYLVDYDVLSHFKLYDDR